MATRTIDALPCRRPRFSGRREVAIGLGAYAVYLGVRALVVNERGRKRAAENAERLVALEERFGIHVEPAVQRVLLERRGLLRVLNVGYVTANVALTVGWLMLLYKRRDPEFHRYRRAAALSLVGACPSFLIYPCAPPRTLDGFVDTVSDVLDMDSGLVVLVYNPIAAMPSIHCAFAVVTGAAMARTARSPLVRGAGRVYPVAVFGTVLATANHYVLDGIAGSGLAALALRLGGARASRTESASASPTGPGR